MRIKRSCTRYPDRVALEYGATKILYSSLLEKIDEAASAWKNLGVQKGDVVETSGFSAVFPAGIFLGKVAEIKNSSDGLAYELEILLSTDLANIRHVNVIIDKRKEELDSLLAQ